MNQAQLFKEFNELSSNEERLAFLMELRDKNLKLDLNLDSLIKIYS